LVSDGSFWLMNVVVPIATFASSVGQSAMYGLLGKFESQRLTQGVQAGGVWGAVLVGVMRVASEAAIPDKQRLSGLIYFSVDSLILLIGMFCVWRFFSTNAARSVSTIESEEEERSLLNIATRKEEKEPFVKLTLKDHWHSTKLTFAPGITILLVFAVTFGLFPGITSILHRNDNWVTIWTMVSFNVGDALGKSLPGLSQPLNSKTILIGNFFHILFIPLYIFVLMNSIWPVVFANQFYTYVIVFGLGFSNGYWTCCGMMLAPGLAITPKEKAAVGNITFMWFSMGIFFGSWAGLAVMFLLK